MSLRVTCEMPVWPVVDCETAELIRSIDWARTPLGPSSHWSQTLRTAVDLMLHARQPAYIAWGPDLISFYNDALLPILGSKHPVAMGRPFQDVWSELLEAFRPQLEATLAGQAQYFVDQPVQLIGQGDDPETRWFTYSWTPLRDEVGEVQGFYCMATETTEKMRAMASQQAEVERALRNSEARFRTLHDNLRDAFVECSLDGRFLGFNDLYCQMLGYRPDEIYGLSYHDVTPERWRLYEEELVREQIIGRGYSDVYEKEYIRKDGSVFPVEIRAVLSRDAEGKPESMWAIVRDISERKARENQVEFLMREVNHRAKNLLALVQAVARQTAKAGRADFIDRFNARLQSLAANQDLLALSQGHGVGLEALVRSQLAHFGELVGDRISLSGPAMVVTASASQTLAMVLHELATNASKYGALSNDQGEVAITWDLTSGEDFVMSWTERGGPPVRTPQQRGFGSTVIVGAAKTGFEAAVELNFAPEGLVWRLKCSRDKVQDSAFFQSNYP